MSNITYRYAVAQKLVIIAILMLIASYLFGQQQHERSSEIFARMERDGYAPSFATPTPIPTPARNWFKKPITLP